MFQVVAHSGDEARGGADKYSIPMSNPDYVYAPIVGWRRYGLERVKQSTRNVNVINPFRVSTPSTGGNLVHPLLTPEFETASYERLVADRRRVNMIALFYMILFPVVTLSLDLSGLAIALFLTCLSIFVVGTHELRFVYPNRMLLKSKVAYYTACLFNKRRVVLQAGFAFLVIGLFQDFLGSQFGGADAMLESFAFIFSSIRDGAYFRIFTGQLLHSGFSHWAANLVGLLWFVALCAPIIGSYAFPVALSISTLAYIALAGIAQFVTFQYDGVIGFSGGVTGLAGFLIGASLAGHPALPAKLYVAMFPPIFITFLVFSFIGNTSLLLHLLGLAIGILTGASYAVYKRKKAVPARIG